VGFIAPSVFVLGALLLAAIVAAYLLRPRRPLRSVSSTFLWLAALHDLESQRPWRRVPPSFLLLLQIAALAAMVGAVARPFVLSTQSTGPFTVVLLDGSASMQATDVKPSRFDAAQAVVEKLIDGLEPSQQLALVALTAQPAALSQASNDQRQLKAALASAAPTALPANLPAALSLSASIAEDHSDAQIVIVGDGSLDRTQVPKDFPIPVRYVGVGSPNASNMAVAGLTTRSANGHLSALARVINYGPQPAVVNLTLKVDGNRFDARTLTIDPNGVATPQWDDLPSAAHTLEASIDSADSLSLDNSAWAVVGGDRPTRVLLVSEGNVFVERALSLRPETQVTRVAPGDYSSQASAYDLIVLDGFVPPVLPSGASVLLLHPPLNNGYLTVGSDISVSTIAAARRDDPLLQDVPLDAAHVSHSRYMTAPSWADTVISSPETPLLLVGERDGRRIGVLGFDVHQSDLPLQPGFPVLMQHLLDWLVPRASTATPVVQVGDPVALAPLPEATGLDVLTPSGQRIGVGPPFPAPAFTGTDAPGLYQVVQRDAAGRESHSYFAVNFVSASESQLKPGTDTGAPSVAGTNQPIKAPHEFWEALAVVALVLLGIELALASWQFTARTLRARLALALRVATAALLALALIGISIPQVVDRQATIFVADVSSSDQSSLSSLSTFLSQAIQSKHQDDAYAIVTTARNAQLDLPLSTLPLADPPDLRTDQPTDGTDLADGVRLAANLLPAGYRAREVLLSDGQETTGDAVAAARALHSRGAELDVVPLRASSGPEVLVESVSTPQNVTEGERFTIGVRLASNVNTDATLRVYMNDQPLADQSVSLSPGTTDLTFGAQAPQSGLVDVRAELTANQDTLSANNTARSVVEVQGPPRILVVEQRPGEGDVIASALQSGGVQLERVSPDQLPDTPEALGSYSAVILADVAASSLSETQQAALQSYVRDLGRGLLAIGGDTSFGQGDYLGTPLDDVLPVRSSVRSHTDQGRVALLLVIDTSGSMADDPYHEGTSKLDMAKQAALLSAQQLSARDQVGILNFDSTPHWLLPLSPVLGMSPSTIADRVGSLVADGGTEIFGALSTGFDAIKDSDARYKHIILMTDGMSCCAGDYATLQERMRAANVTLSTIAVGGDADTDLLSQLAKQGDGRYYFAEHARDIPRLMTRETDLATRGPLVEGDITPRQVSPDPTLSSLAASGLPQLSGYLVTSPKDLAEVLVVSDAADPILARWQYGLGRAVAWTSDLRGRWTQDWLQWPGTAQLFSSLVNWTIAPAHGPVQVSLRADAAEGHITVAETTAGAAPAPVTAHIVKPDGSGMQVDVAPTAPGEYAASFPLDGPGTYIVRVQEQGVGDAEAGLPVSYPAEFRQVSADPDRMNLIASAGGGHVLYSPADAFANDLAPVTTPLPLQRVLVLIAAILLPLDVILRRLRISPRDLWDWLRHPHRVELSMPGFELPSQSPAWVPGAWKPKSSPAPSPTVWAKRNVEPSLGAHATPGLARDSNVDPEEESALASASRWLSSRRTTDADRG
jgi:Mg-chelatase subunit ChlD